MSDQRRGGTPGPDRPDEESPERLYVITGGRTASTSRRSIDLVSLVVALTAPDPMTPPEQAQILRLCHTPLSVAEISAYLRLPVSVITVLLSDLADRGGVQVRGPVPIAALPDRELLEAVINGLQRL
ncbi:DUF742 domain-containing protein [Streptacidiphilus fuscans]|uniref:DUF742 domain-containing protein n=1 Tax=Streptacidiphilus fuscans TaxID=2789292 RepID=A0A931B1Y0_9ACTN|nr:DUF742 domain-containing protein [Streptacidiphilus fuscans]MBF9067197.1 DUF742 domain-containing protein [Streptacidiphilus fuscans]